MDMDATTFFAALQDSDDVLVLLIICAFAVVGLAIVLCFVSRCCVCLGDCCECLRRCICQPKKPHAARVSLFVHQQRRSVRDVDADFMEPFLGPPNYDQPYDEASPPPYRNLPSAPPLSP
ncbi:hypothetical protein SPRG_05410 [Saprolegnia parasitica CBS 223.65]|uniref:Uncharacterized protein n=1 Tax=Saprolegnia parasitica (strain CBS 223.65) TaxID=695850 RepID=A0A067CRP3_SAPPC|nr:hypothetical protein SPRG_05410 [Saprolegnia parasitica CBS 223.65]KDO29166.1 hypothetical protein SPRG_05410 [Saprolegnia parasitica CBS 223.65]|eukprot:XP_012200045.1 hypothetical protein SPRG_05410 [Saprolegnia parasitica CBS 223.65]